MEPGWRHVSKSGKIVEPSPKEVRGSETIDKVAIMATIVDLARDISLSSLIDVIAHAMREEPTHPKYESSPRAIFTSIQLYLVNHGW